MRFTSFLLFCKQSYLAQKSLDAQLQRLGELSSTECISISNEDFEIFKTRRSTIPTFYFVIGDYSYALFWTSSFLIVWVEQGDEISLEYAGTHALKRDLVR